MVVIFVASSMLSAILLFSVQPMVTKILLPSFGGTPAVWNTAVLFFQTSLLLGYLYTHIATNRLRPRLQITLHLILVAAVAATLPITVSAEPPDAGTLAVIWSVIWALTLGVGAPFLIVSATGPLVQRWFSWTDHPRAHDPYFLYAASNFGSLLGLLAYPFLVEPTLDLTQQRGWWSIGYVLLLGGLAISAVFSVRRWQRQPVLAERGVAELDTRPPEPAARPRRREYLRWVGLAFVPSSLMLGVTTFLSTDVAAVPLLWVVPLAIYLATFVMAFGDRAGRLARTAGRLLPAVAVAAGGATFVRWPIVVTIPVNLLLFGCVALLIHQRLADRRPPPRQLTFYYLMIAIGGALGGLLNGLIAPVLFVGPFEYEGVLVIALLLCMVPTERSGEQLGGRGRIVQLVTAPLLPLAVAGLLIIDGERETAGLVALVALLVLIVRHPWSRSPIAMAVAMALLMAPLVRFYLTDHPEVADRSFFGVYRVTSTAASRRLTSGTTLHGLQLTDPARQEEPTLYYTADGPLGSIMGLPAAKGTIGAVGLGVGTIAAYLAPGQRLVFHEIDPTVVEIAQFRGGFTFLQDAAGLVEIVLGDGRLTLQTVPPGAYDVLVLDAFTSDAIPVHLLTIEAFSTYLDVLAPEGVIAVHISNRHLDLVPVIAATAKEFGLTGRLSLEGPTWVALAKDASFLPPPGGKQWSELPTDRVVRWTDAFSNLVAVIK